MAPRPGPILEINTNVRLGQHNGLWTYTIGQCARLPGLSMKLFVACKDHQKNAIYVALPESVQSSLFLRPAPFFSRPHLRCLFSRDATPTSAFSHEGFRASVQIRHRMTTVPVTVHQRWTSNAVQITFDEPLKAVAQGQIAVLYDGDNCLGCGTIDETTSMSDFGYRK